MPAPRLAARGRGVLRSGRRRHVRAKVMEVGPPHTHAVHRFFEPLFERIASMVPPSRASSEDECYTHVGSKRSSMVVLADDEHTTTGEHTPATTGMCVGCCYLALHQHPSPQQRRASPCQWPLRSRSPRGPRAPPPTAKRLHLRSSHLQLHQRPPTQHGPTTSTTWPLASPWRPETGAAA